MRQSDNRGSSSNSAAEAPGGARQTVACRAHATLHLWLLNTARGTPALRRTRLLPPMLDAARRHCLKRRRRPPQLQLATAMSMPPAATPATPGVVVGIAAARQHCESRLLLRPQCQRAFARAKDSASMLGTRSKQRSKPRTRLPIRMRLTLLRMRTRRRFSLLVPGAATGARTRRCGAAKVQPAHLQLCLAAQPRQQKQNRRVAQTRGSERQSCCSAAGHQKRCSINLTSWAPACDRAWPYRLIKNSAARL